MPMRFDLTDLRLFVTAVRGGSITRGAEAVHLALASASQRISALEETFGAPLLERVPRGVRPTQAGLVLFGHAEDILARTDRMLGELGAFVSGERGRVRLLSNTGALLGFLPRALGRFLLAHSGLDVDIEEQPSTEIVRRVTERSAELGVMADVVDAGGLELHTLVEDRLFVVMAWTHPLAARKEAAFEAVLREPLVGLMEAALDRHLAEHAARRGSRLADRVRLRSVRDVGRAVENGVGLAVLPESTLSELEGMAVRAMPLAETWGRRRLALCCRSVEELSPHARLLFDHLRAAAADSGQDGSRRDDRRS
jgi:DNA-binding transcriptional LysR family regulator